MSEEESKSEDIVVENKSGSAWRDKLRDSQLEFERAEREDVLKVVASSEVKDCDESTVPEKTTTETFKEPQIGNLDYNDIIITETGESIPEDDSKMYNGEDYTLNISENFICGPILNFIDTKPGLDNVQAIETTDKAEPTSENLFQQDEKIIEITNELSNVESDLVIPISGTSDGLEASNNHQRDATPEKSVVSGTQEYFPSSPISLLHLDKSPDGSRNGRRTSRSKSKTNSEEEMKGDSESNSKKTKSKYRHHHHHSDHVSSSHRRSRRDRTEEADPYGYDSSLFIAIEEHGHSDSNSKKDVIVEGNLPVKRHSSYVNAVGLPASVQIAEVKVHRRTSYKMATNKSRTSASSATDQTLASLDRTQNSRNRTSVTDIDQSLRPHRSKREKRYLSPVGAIGNPQFTGGASMESVMTPTKTSGMKRFKDLFSDKAFPKDISAEVDHSVPGSTVLSSLGPAVFEGSLNCKNTMVDGKRSVDRAWKSTYAVLRGHSLCLHPDKISQTVVVYEHPISIQCAFVDIAYDYLKRKNVFRLMTFKYSEYLLEAQSVDEMLQWIKLIQDRGYSNDQTFSIEHCCLFLTWINIWQSAKFSSNLEKVEKSHGISSVKTRGNPEEHSRKQLLMSAAKFDKRKTSDQNRLSRTSSKRETLGVNTGSRQRRDNSTSPEVTKLQAKSAALEQVKSLSTQIDQNEPKSKTWKDKLGKKFKRAQSQTMQTTGVVESSGTFGIPLEKCVPSTSNEFVPRIVETCIKIIESKGLAIEGMYRIPGNSVIVSALKAEIDKDPYGLCPDNEMWQHRTAVVSLLKLFFRDLPDPLITTDLYNSVIEANHVEDKTKRLLKLKRLIHHLPPHNFETFHYLAAHLKKVTTFGDVNFMDARNLGIVFGPTLLQPKQDNMMSMVKDMSDQCQVLESIIQNCEWFFGSWDEDVHVPGSEGSAIPVTSIDQGILEKAEHKFLEEQAQNAKKSLKHPVTVLRPVKKDMKVSSAVYSVESVYCERNIEDELVRRKGRITEAKPATKEDLLKMGKSRAKSVPPRPQSVILPNNKASKEEINTSACSTPKRNNLRKGSSPSPAIGSTRPKQYRRSNSEISDKVSQSLSNSPTVVLRKHRGESNLFALADTSSDKVSAKILKSKNSEETHEVDQKNEKNEKGLLTASSGDRKSNLGLQVHHCRHQKTGKSSSKARASVIQSNSDTSKKVGKENEEMPIVEPATEDSRVVENDQPAIVNVPDEGKFLPNSASEQISSRVTEEMSSSLIVGNRKRWNAELGTWEDLAPKSVACVVEDQLPIAPEISSKKISHVDCEINCSSDKSNRLDYVDLSKQEVVETVTTVGQDILPLKPLSDQQNRQPSDRSCSDSSSKNQREISQDKASVWQALAKTYSFDNLQDQSSLQLIQSLVSPHRIRQQKSVSSTKGVDSKKVDLIVSRSSTLMRRASSAPDVAVLSSTKSVPQPAAGGCNKEQFVKKEFVSRQKRPQSVINRSSKKGTLVERTNSHQNFHRAGIAAGIAGAQLRESSRSLTYESSV